MKNSPNQTSTIVYISSIIALFAAMLFYGNYLKRIKNERDLGEATLGQIDTGSFMMKLFLLGGARGIAANWLWSQAHELQKAHEWDRLETKITQITKLQPHFLNVWEFQGWNMAYNVSVEWDAPEDKYDWIKKGNKFLQNGVEKNRDKPDLIWDVAWNYYHKLGFSDETIIFRRLFYDDDDENFRTYVDRKTKYSHTDRDNFQLGYGWFHNAVALIDEGSGERLDARFDAPVEYVDRVEQRKGRPGDLHFRSMPAHALTRYASRLEIESTRGITPTFGEKARSEWEKAERAWEGDEFGTYGFPMFRKEEISIYLDDYTRPERWEKLPEQQRYWTRRWASETHYPYWKDRALAEMTKEGVEARRLFYEGTKAYMTADFPKAVELFDKGLRVWEELLKHHVPLATDDLNMKDTGVIVKRYLRALENADRQPPADMPFKDILDKIRVDNNPDPFNGQDMQIAAPASEAPQPGDY